MADDNVVVLTSSGDSSLMEELSDEEERAQDTGTSSEEYVEEDSDELLLELESDSDMLEMSDECPLSTEPAEPAAVLGKRRVERGQESRMVLRQDNNSSPYSYTNQLHKLEGERRDLVSELQEVKEKSLYTEQGLTQSREYTATLTDNHSKAIEALKAELMEAKENNDKIISQNRQLSTNILAGSHDTDELECTQRQLMECRDQLSAALMRLKEAESSSIQLMRSNRTVKVLERQVSQLQDDQRAVALSRQRVLNYDSLVYRNEALEQHNNALKERVGNLELLRYQLQMEREKCEKLQEMLSTTVDVDKVKSEDTSSSSSVVLKYRLLHAQQREVILTRHCGEQDTTIRVREGEVRSLKEENIELKRQLTLGQEDGRSKDDCISRLERRLRFIVKEREGCINVLNSYKLDGGAEVVLKDQISELQETLKRYEEKVEELEATNTELYTHVHTDTKRSVVSDEETSSLRERLLLVEQQCEQLKRDRQKMEERLMQC